VLQKQVEMRRVLFASVDFESITDVLDVGCGLGTDLIQMAEQFPHLRLDGFTVTERQAELGMRRVRERALDERVSIHHADSGQHLFPRFYDLIFGIEVTFHIADKRRLFKNIATSLNFGGQLLLIDYVSNMRGAIVDPAIGVSIPTGEELAGHLAEQGLCAMEVVDASREIANFLEDPLVDKNTEGLPEVARKTLISYANQSISLRQGWTSYCLLRVEHPSSPKSAAELEAATLARLHNRTPYLESAAGALRGGVASYPRSAAAATLAGNTAPAVRG
jgi:SAM-dependent methyltransferase